MIFGMSITEFIMFIFLCILTVTAIVLAAVALVRKYKTKKSLSISDLAAIYEDLKKFAEDTYDAIDGLETAASVKDFSSLDEYKDYAAEHILTALDSMYNSKQLVLPKYSELTKDEKLRVIRGIIKVPTSIKFGQDTNSDD